MDGLHFELHDPQTPVKVLTSSVTFPSPRPRESGHNRKPREVCAKADRRSRKLPNASDFICIDMTIAGFPRHGLQGSLEIRVVARVNEFSDHRFSGDRIVS